MDPATRTCAATAAVMLLLAGCSGPRAHAPSAAASPSPSSDGIEDGAPCPPAPAELGLPDDAGCASAASGIFSPAPRGTDLISYALVGEEGYPRRWRLRVMRPDGEWLEEPIYAGSATSYPRLLGTADANDDGSDEAFVKVATHSYHSGATHEIAIFGVRPRDIYRVQIDGRPSLFQVGGVSTFGEGVECRDVDLDGDPELVLLRIDFVFGEIQRFSERVYEWEGTGLRFSSRREGRMAKTGYNDPLLYRYYSLRCFDF
ncbi:MAG TPA: hypothetical protein VIG64_14880, partial [Actinomycetota bacterium]